MNKIKAVLASIKVGVEVANSIAVTGQAGNTDA